ncbi:hypothetical protein EDB19DRAFT_1629938, partial [Suillus lakei]
AAGWSLTTSTELAEMQTYETAIKKWDKNDVIVRQQIAVLVPDTLFIQLLSLTSTKDFFDMLKNQFENQSLAVTMELCCQLGELKLKEGGDAQAHVDTL